MKSFLIKLLCSFLQLCADRFSVNFGQFLKTLFIEYLQVAAPGPCKNFEFVILQISAKFKKYLLIFLL